MRFKADFFFFNGLVNQAQLVILREYHAILVQIATRQCALLVNISIISYALASIMPLRVISNPLGNLWVRTDNEVAEDIHDGILNVLWVVYELVCWSCQSSHFLCHLICKVDRLLTYWFEPNFIVWNYGNILPKRFLLNQLFRYYLIIHNNVK